MSTRKDADTFLEFVQEFFVSSDLCPQTTFFESLKAEVQIAPGPVSISLDDDGPPVQSDEAGCETQSAVLCAIFVYPIKSCAGFSVRGGWPLGSHGLLYDREFALIDAATRKVMTQKDCPALLKVRPSLDLQSKVMAVRWGPGAAVSDLRVDFGSGRIQRVEVESTSKGLFAKPEGGSLDTKSEASRWFSSIIGRQCSFSQINGLGRRMSHHPEQTKSTDVFIFNNKNSACGVGVEATDGSHGNAKTIPEPHGLLPRASITGCGVLDPSRVGFANEGEILLVSEGSIADLQRRIDEQASGSFKRMISSVAGEPPCVTAETFRPNFVVKGVKAYAEDKWVFLRVGLSEDASCFFRVVKPCSRCRMINIDQTTGEQCQIPLRVLASYRRSKSKIFFGQLLAIEKGGGSSGRIEGHLMKVGDPLVIMQSR